MTSEKFSVEKEELLKFITQIGASSLIEAIQAEIPISDVPLDTIVCSSNKAFNILYLG